MALFLKIFILVPYIIKYYDLALSILHTYLNNCEDAYWISFVVSDFSDKDIDITLEKEKLSIVGRKEPVEGEVSYLNRGIT